jgi:hypothetical protein
MSEARQRRTGELYIQRRDAHCSDLQKHAVASEGWPLRCCCGRHDGQQMVRPSRETGCSSH